ncbi:MAG TPA: hypothetical protein VM716_04975 [Gemmatimonadales bacterium]|nr:hypothetical protein [Gemmatimonadales bacterium]
MEHIQALEDLVGFPQAEFASLHCSHQDIGTVDPMPRANAPLQETPGAQVLDRDEPPPGERHRNAFRLSWIDELGPIREYDQCLFVVGVELDRRNHTRYNQSFDSVTRRCGLEFSPHEWCNAPLKLWRLGEEVELSSFTKRQEQR